ncbi:hypothetical protein PG993_008806 [Apiospora rasikravindrae]|uniref:Rhodopsin domain-containing protein n=1 Tax=Apiospora rasikravindrae TaxID=990691 RepID=A0ABR1SPH4_9PEZI
MPFDVNGTITVIPPPPGYVVNFADPPQEGGTVMWTVCIVENILAVLFLVQRLYTKIFLVGKFQVEDGRYTPYPLYVNEKRPDPGIRDTLLKRVFNLTGTVILAWLSSIATQGYLLHLYQIKAVGVHAFEMSLEKYIVFSKVIFSAPLIYTITVGAAKGTLCLFYRRINPARSFQLGVWILFVICVGSSAAVFFSLLFACKPFRANWDPLLANTASCLDRPAIYVATAAIGVFTDVMLLIFPIPTVLGLKIKTKQKVALILFFVFGSITMITSVVRLILLLPSLSNPDQTYALTSGTLWICIEANLLIMCCCLPTLRKFFRHVAPSWIGESKDSSSAGGRSTSKLNAYVLRTFGGSGAPAKMMPGGRRHKSQLDSIMRTQGTRIDDTDYDKTSLDGTGWRSDSRFGATTDIRGGRDDRSVAGEGSCRGDFESDKEILRSTTVRVESARLSYHA